MQAWRLVFSPQHLCKEWSMMNPFVSQELGRWSLLHSCNSLASQPSLIGKRSLTYISTYACVWAHICTQRKYIMHSCTEHRSVSLGTEKWESMKARGRSTSQRELLASSCWSYCADSYTPMSKLTKLCTEDAHLCYVFNKFKGVSQVTYLSGSLPWIQLSN